MTVPSSSPAIFEKNAEDAYSEVSIPDRALFFGRWRISWRWEEGEVAQVEYKFPNYGSREKSQRDGYIWRLYSVQTLLLLLKVSTGDEIQPYEYGVP